jgi:phage/plasmid primase-like uncharacterized protein
MSLVNIVNTINQELQLGMETRDRLIADIRQNIIDRRAMLDAEEKIAEQRIETIKSEFAERDANLRKLVAETA